MEDKIDYAFDVTKAGQIFDHLLKDKKIKLLDGHIIFQTDEIKGKRYYKWHNLYNHFTDNCIILWRAIQKEIKECKFKSPNKEISKMSIDINLFPI